MKLTIHRGTHEIGGSCVEIEHGQSRVLLDIGIPLVDDLGNKFESNKYDYLSGYELVNRGILPDLKEIYSWNHDNPGVDAILISHSHMDHYGYLKYTAREIPFYLGKATHELIDLTFSIYWAIR